VALPRTVAVAGAAAAATALRRLAPVYVRERESSSIPRAAGLDHVVDAQVRSHAGAERPLRAAAAGARDERVEDQSPVPGRLELARTANAHPCN